MKRTNLLSQVIAIVVMLVSPGMHAWATNGYFTHGVGVNNKALAGAGSASPSEAVVTALNPAAAVVVGNRTEIGVSFFSPNRSYRASASHANGQSGSFTLEPGRIESDNKVFPIPYFGKIWQRGEDTAFAINFYGRGGMNTDYQGGSATFDPDGPGPEPITNAPGTYGYETTGVDLSQAFVDLTYAKRTGSVSWGLSLVLAAQSFEAEGLGNFAGLTETFARSSGASSPKNLTNNGHDVSFGFGAKVGAIWNITERLNLAASYQSETNMQPLEKYSDLFAESGSFNVPANLRVGTSWRMTSSATLHFDVDRTFFSDVGSVGNSAAGLVDCPTAGFGGENFEACLGGDQGIGFGWEDVTTYHIGVESYFSATPRWLWRAGFSTSNSPIRSSETLFNILAPAVVVQHYTLGSSRRLDDGDTLSVSVMYAPSSDVRGRNMFDPTQVIELEMHQFELEIGFSW